jgi:symplekin
MAAPVALSIEDQINQLDDARRLVLSDASYYPRIIQGILPIINREARVELKRWVTDFLAETFASPQLPSQQKETLGLVVLETLRSLLENPQEDAVVVESVVQTAASVYPLVLRWMYVVSYLPSFNPSVRVTAAIHSAGLGRWTSMLSMDMLFLIRSCGLRNLTYPRK